MKTRYAVRLSVAALVLLNTFCVYAANDTLPGTKTPAIATRTARTQTAPIKKAVPPKAVSDCNHNGINDLDEFWPPDCYGKLTSGGNTGR